LEEEEGNGSDGKIGIGGILLYHPPLQKLGNFENLLGHQLRVAWSHIPTFRHFKLLFHLQNLIEAKRTPPKVNDLKIPETGLTRKSHILRRKKMFGVCQSRGSL
jgi:hypothetical protein